MHSQSVGGYSLKGISVNEEDFQWVVQEALDQVDFVLGDAATSPMAKLRADLGHPEPFTRVKYIEIGNEDLCDPSSSHLINDLRSLDFNPSFLTASPKKGLSSSCRFVAIVLQRLTFWFTAHLIATRLTGGPCFRRLSRRSTLIFL